MIGSNWPDWNRNENSTKMFVKINEICIKSIQLNTIVVDGRNLTVFNTYLLLKEKRKTMGE